MKQSNRTAWSYSYKFILFSFENKHTFLGRQWKAHFILTAWFCVLQSFSLVYKTICRIHTVIWFIKPYSQPVFPLWTAVLVEVCTHESASDSALWMARKYKAPHECWCIETNLLINGCFFHTAVPVHPSCSIMELCYQSIYMFTAIRLMIHGLKTLVQHDAAKGQLVCTSYASDCRQNSSFWHTFAFVLLGSGCSRYTGANMETKHVFLYKRKLKPHRI